MINSGLFKSLSVFFQNILSKFRVSMSTWDGSRCSWWYEYKLSIERYSQRYVTRQKYLKLVGFFWVMRNGIQSSEFVNFWRKHSDLPVPQAGLRMSQFHFFPLIYDSICSPCLKISNANGEKNELSIAERKAADIRITKLTTYRSTMWCDLSKTTQIFQTQTYGSWWKCVCGFVCFCNQDHLQIANE